MPIQKMVKTQFMKDWLLGIEQVIIFPISSSVQLMITAVLEDVCVNKDNIFISTLLI